jgi:pre-mRNA-processing factor 19
LYERRLIEKYIKDNGKCPVTGNDLNEEDLLSVKGRHRICNSSYSSYVIGSLFEALQSTFSSCLEFCYQTPALLLFSFIF